jgi:hypothetical protein
VEVGGGDAGGVVPEVGRVRRWQHRRALVHVPQVRLFDVQRGKPATGTG